MNAKIDAAAKAQAERESRWRYRRAKELAARYWQSPAGKREVEVRDAAIASMRAFLNYPSFEFGVDELQKFLRIQELGRIRLGHEKKIIEQLPKLKAILQAMAESASPVSSLEPLQTVAGVGRNLATKFLAIHQPEKFVVVNEPVESALRGFDYELDMSAGATVLAYSGFLRDLRPFIEECESAGLKPASGLDAFFYDFRNASV